MKRITLVLVLAFLGLVPVFSAVAVLDAEAGAEKPQMRSAIFVQNRGDKELQSQVDVLNDQLTAALTEKGFSIIDRKVVMEKFREDGVDDAPTGASALRLAQMMGADFIVMATIDSLGLETRTFRGEGTTYGSANEATIYTLRIGVKVLDGQEGRTVYGETVVASERVVVEKNLSIRSTDVIPKLIEAGAKKVSGNIADKVAGVVSAKAAPAVAVEFTVNSNIEGATVELDGAVMGSTPGRFSAVPGIHQLRITKEWLSPWEKMVNIHAGQVLNINLELTEEGARRFENFEKLKLNLTRSKQQHDMEMKEREAVMDSKKSETPPAPTAEEAPVTEQEPEEEALDGVVPPAERFRE